MVNEQNTSKATCSVTMLMMLLGFKFMLHALQDHGLKCTEIELVEDDKVLFYIN